MLKIINIFLRISIIFLICFIWARYFIKNLTLSLIYASALTLAIDLLIYMYLKTKNAKFKIKKDEESLSEKIAYNFIFNPDKCLSYFYKLCSIKYSVKKQANYLIFDKKNEDQIQKQNSLIILYPYFSYNIFSSQDLIILYNKLKKHNPSKIIICCYKYNQEINKIINSFEETDIIVLDYKQTFIKLIKKNNYFPENLKEVKLNNKQNLKDFFKKAINKSKAKNYLLCSFILIISSFFIRMNLYYIIFATLLLILSLVCLLYQPNKIIIDDELL